MKSRRLVSLVPLLPLVVACAAIRADQQTRPDIDGDPLPEGAAARFGSQRLRMPAAVEMVAISPDSKLVAAVNMHGKVSVWKTKTGQLLHELSGSTTGEACLAFSPHGRYLATGGRFDSLTGSGDFRVRVWDLKNGKVKTTLPAQQGSISKLIFTSDGSTLVSAGFDQPVIAWKVSTGEKLREFAGEEYTFHHVAISSDDKWIAVSNRDLKNVTVFSMDGTRLICRLENKRSSSIVSSLVPLEDP